MISSTAICLIFLELSSGKVVPCPSDKMADTTAHTCQMLLEILPSCLGSRSECSTRMTRWCRASPEDCFTARRGSTFLQQQRSTLGSCESLHSTSPRLQCHVCSRCLRKDCRRSTIPSTFQHLQACNMVHIMQEWTELLVP